MNDDPPSILDRLEEQGKAAPRLRLPEAPEGPAPRLGAVPLRHSGRFSILGEIATGGVGQVLKGRDRDLGRDVAVKVLLERHLDDRQIVQRFVEEAQIGGQLGHPGIVPVYELGLGDDRRPFFAMKLVKGRTLASLLADRAGPAEDRRRFLEIFEEVCQTVGYAHSRRVIHRDLKPSNVMVGAFGEVQVLDWGFAKVLPRGGVEDERRSRAPVPERTRVETIRSLTEGSESIPGSVMGTLSYMPPEQALGQVEELTERSDVFSLGAMLSEILTGEPPYTAPGLDRLVQAAQAQLSECFGRLDACGADAALVDLAKRCLSALSKDRPRNAGAVAEAVHAHLSAAEERVRRMAIEKATAQEEAARAREEARAQRRLRRLGLALSAAVLLLVAVAGGSAAWLAAQGRDRAERARREVLGAILTAERRRGEGQWEEALAAAETARELADAAAVDGATRERARALRAAVAEGAAAARAEAEQRARDETLIAELEEANLARIDSTATESDRAFRAAFARYGLDPEGLAPAEFAAKLSPRGDRVVATVAVALDTWAGRRKQHRAGDWKLLLRAAAAADPDPRRQHLRTRIEAGDDTGLLALAADPGTLDLPPASVGLLAGMLRNAGRCREAADLVTKAGRRHPGDPWLHYQLYGSFHELELPGQAFRYALAAAALRPGSAEIRNSLGALLLEAGDHEGAWTCCRAALRIAPGHEHAPGNSIIDLEALGDHAGATTLAEEVLRRAAEGSVAPGSRGRALEHLGRLDEATEAYRQAIEGDPENLWAYERLGSVLEAAGRFEEAVECYRCARARLSTLVESPQHAKWLAWLHGRLGLVLCDKLGRIDEAIDHFRQAIALAPDKAEHLSNLGVALRKTGHLEEAIAAWEQALRVDPGYLHTYGVLGFALTQLDRLDEAEAALRTAAERGEGPGSLAQLGTFLEIRMRGRPGENIELLTEAVRREPGNPDYLNNLATALLSAMRGAEALEVLERLPEGEKEQTARSFNLGRALAILGRWQEAEPFLRRGAEGLPTPWPWELLGRTLSTLGRHPEAVEAFRKSIALGPERAKSHGLLGRALLQTGAMKEAADALRKALELDPRDAETAAQLGFLLSQRLGRHGEAVAPLFRAVALEPGRGAWWTFLALALSNVGRLDAAIASARKGAALQASWPEAHRILGLLLHRAGRYAEAIEILSEGVDLHPRDALIRLGLAQALCNQGEYREALARLGEVEELGAPPGVDLARLFEWFRWLAEATERMPEYLAGHWKPESTTGLLALGSVLQSPQHADRPVAAARLYRELFTKESAAARGSTPAGANLANPVCAAVCAGTGEGKDAAGLPEAERAAWRRTALGWLRDLLALARQTANPAAAEAARTSLDGLFRDNDLRAVRDEPGLAKLPPAERREWEAAWAEVRALAAPPAK